MKSGLADRTLPLFIRIIQLCRSFIPTPCTLKTKRERERAGAYRNPPMASVHKFRGFFHKFAYQKLTRKNEKNRVGIRERSNASGCIFMRYEPNQRSNISKDVVRFKVTENRLIRYSKLVRKVSSSRQREKNTWNNNEGGSVLNNEGNIPSAVSSTRLETRVDPASRCFAIIIRNNAFISPLRPVLALFYLLSNRHPRVSFLFLSLSLFILFNPFSLSAITILSFLFTRDLSLSPHFSFFFPFFFLPLSSPPFPFRFIPLPCFPYRRQSVVARRVAIARHPPACREYCFASSSRPKNVLICIVQRWLKNRLFFFFF